ncbi:YihY/virulence factor BrkB family protein [Ascidiimonas sp. W6]|uniref:YihY/virulence factor BrkB family protein n=1 Tax=Ascidiimonas meishanensis TaxID=3128903 RepID=UPI0030ED4E61
MTKKKLKTSISIVIETIKSWNADNPWRLSAVVAFYAVLSLPALLIILINVVGIIWGTEAVQGKLTNEFSQVLGMDSAKSIQTMIASAEKSNQSYMATVVGIGTLIFGATGVFYQLKISLNEIWKINPIPRTQIIKIITDRVISFGFILVIGFLLLVSLVLTAAISLLNDFIRELFPDIVLYIGYTLDAVISMGIITVLFALIFKYLPDAKIQWKTVWRGATVTAFLFVAGKFLLGIYFGQASPDSTYGAAGSIILILLWVFYSCLILLLGAKFTAVYAEKYGLGIKPASNAELKKSP